MKFLSPLMAALLLVNVIACKDSNTTKKMQISAMDIGVLEKREDEKTATTDSGYYQEEKKEYSPGIPKPAHSSDKIDWDKKIIKEGNITIEVKDFNQFNKLIRTKVKELGGYIAQEEQTQTDYKIENSVVIKVPVDQFDEGVSSLTASADKIIDRKISSEDVTTEIIDTKSRMEARKKVRDRYLELLKQAKNMAEVLQVQTEINNTQEEVESAAGRIAYLGHSTAYSTINISFYQVLNASAVQPKAPTYGERIISSFSIGLQWIGELFIMRISLWPLWIVLSFLWLFIKRLRPQHSKKQETHVIDGN